MFDHRIALLFRRVIQHVDMLVAGLRANSLYTRQSFEHALNALLAALSSDALIPDNFQGDGFEHEPFALLLRTKRGLRGRRSVWRRMSDCPDRLEEISAAAPE